MRGSDHRQQKMFFYISMEKRILKDHPLRLIKVMVDGLPKGMDEWFSGMYAGEPDIGQTCQEIE